jgi:outer membrane protein assembly factor BamB
MLAILFVGAGQAFAAEPGWTQWGGPNRDFMTTATGLAERWPEAGPRQIWRRALGQGHSSILFEEGRLYTMYRNGSQEIACALKADTGETIWEYSYDAPPKPDMQMGGGGGPHSTPLIVGDRVFTVGGTVVFHCLDKNTGKVLWSHDLMEKLGASHIGRGYGPSPLAYESLVIVPVGGKEAGLAAFSQETGEVVWKSEPLRPSQSSPILARVHGDDHLVAAMGADRVGLDPKTGATRWKVTLDRQAAAIMSTPVLLPPDRVFFSSAYGGGSYMFKILKSDSGQYSAEQLWHDKRLKVQHGNAVVVGDAIIGSSGDFGPAFLMAINPANGDVHWRERGFTKSTILKVGDRLLILDEQGNLVLAAAGPDGLNIISRSKPLQDKAWTIPTLIGTTLYLRDLKDIVALDLSAAGNS